MVAIAKRKLQVFLNMDNNIETADDMKRGLGDIWCSLQQGDFAIQ